MPSGRLWHGDKTRRTDSKLTSEVDCETARQQRGSTDQTDTEAQCREETMAASLNLIRSKPWETGRSVCDVGRATKTSDWPSCSVEYRLQAIE